MPTWGDGGTRGERIKEKAPLAGYGAGLGAAGLGAQHLRGARKHIYGSQKFNRRVLRGGAAVAGGTALVAGTAGRGRLSQIKSDFTRRKKAERPPSRVDFNAPDKVQSVRTKNTQVGMQGGLNRHDAQDANAKDWGGMATRASDAIERQKRMVKGPLSVKRKTPAKSKPAPPEDRTAWVMDSRIPGLVDRGWKP